MTDISKNIQHSSAFNNETFQEKKEATMVIKASSPIEAESGAALVMHQLHLLPQQKQQHSPLKMELNKVGQQIISSNAFNTTPLTVPDQQKGLLPQTIITYPESKHPRGENGLLFGLLQDS